MARYSSTGSSGNLFAVVVAGLAIALFTIIVMWPNGSAKTIVTKIPDTPLTQTLNDPETYQYLAALHRVKPKVAAKLQAQAETAIESGADKNQLAALVLETYSKDVEDDLKYLFSADVKHFEKMLQLSERGLSTLSSKAPKYCRPAHYERYEHMPPQQIANEVSSLFEYGSEG